MKQWNVKVYELKITNYGCFSDTMKFQILQIIKTLRRPAQWAVCFNEIMKMLYIMNKRSFNETMKSKNSWKRAISMNLWNVYVFVSWQFQWYSDMTNF